MYGKEYLKSKLNTVRERVLVRYDYYNMKNVHTQYEVAIPWRVANAYKSRLGWCTKAVDLLADRLVVKGFKDDTFDMQGIFNMNNSDVLFDSAILGALISACDFIYIFRGADGEVKLQVIDGSNATGIIDRTTNLLTEGYAVLERDAETNSPVIEAYFTPIETVYTDKKQGIEYSIPNPTGHPLLVPIINQPDSDREFGHSRIARNMMKTQDQAEELLTRMNVVSEVASFPQKYILGLSEDAGEIDKLKASVSSMLRFDKDSDGDRPTVGQFQQYSMSGHIDGLDAYVSLFSGMSSLTRDDLGFVTENPSSAESKKAALEALRVIASKAQRSFGVGFINTGYIAACLRDEVKYKRSEVYKTKVLWGQLVEPDSAMLSAIGDGVIKINQAVPNFIDGATLSLMTGIDGNEVVDNGLFDFEVADSL